MTVAAEHGQHHKADSPSEHESSGGTSHLITVDLGSGFAWEALRATSAELGVSPEELLKFSLSYYLADFDSGRIARQVPAGAHRLSGLSSRPRA